MSIVNSTKIQVPLEKEIKEKWEKYVTDHGFDSLQAYIRFIAKADTDGRQVSLDTRARLDPGTAERYDKAIAEHLEIEKKGNVKSFDNAEEFIQDIWS